MKKIIKRFISAVLSVSLMFLAFSGNKILAADDGEEKLGITYLNNIAYVIYANGNSIIIADKDGNDNTQTDTFIYLDSNDNGQLDDNEKDPVDLTAKGLPANNGNTSTGYDLNQVSIFGGCHGIGGNLTESSKYVSKTKITMIGGTVWFIYGGSSLAAEVKNGTSVTISGSSYIKENVFGGGGYTTAVNGNTNVVIKDSARIDGSVYGGGTTSCNVNGNTNVSISGSASIGGSVFGGDTHESGVFGSTNVNISGSASITGSVFGGGIEGGTIEANTNVNISGSARIDGSVFGGGKNAIFTKFGIPINGVYGSTNISVKDNVIISGHVIGGGWEEIAPSAFSIAVSGNTNINLSDSAHIVQSVWGAGYGYAKANKSFIKISDVVSIDGSVYGGGNTTNATVSGSYIINNPAKAISVSGDITLPENLTVSPDQTMTILNDSILRIPSGRTLENNGTIINNKIIINNGTISGTGILKNIITYVLMGGVNNPDNTDYYAYGTGLTLKDPTYSPMLFGGWYTNSDYIEDTKVASFGSNDTAAKTVYARWIDPAAHTITYDANGATVGSVPTNTHTYLAGVTVPVAGNPGELVKTGYVFGGWSETPNGTAVTTYTMGTSNLIFYAVWTSNSNLNGSPISVSSPEKPIDIILPDNLGLPHPEFISARPIGNAFDEPVRLSISPAPNNRERFRQAFANNAHSWSWPADSDAFYFDMDILSKITGKKLQPKDGTGVEVTIPLPKNFYKDKDKVTAITIHDGKAGVIPIKIVDKDNMLYGKYTIWRFSPFALIIDRDASFSSLAAGAPVSENPTPIKPPSGIPYIILSLGLTAGIIFFNTKRLKNRK